MQQSIFPKIVQGAKPMYVLFKWLCDLKNMIGKYFI